MFYNAFLVLFCFWHCLIKVFFNKDESSRNKTFWELNIKIEPIILLIVPGYLRGKKHQNICSKSFLVKKWTCFLEFFLVPTSPHFYELYLIGGLWGLQSLVSQIILKQCLPLPAILLWSSIFAHSSCLSTNMLKIYEICLHWFPQKFLIFSAAPSWLPVWIVLENSRT